MIIKQNNSACNLMKCIKKRINLNVEKNEMCYNKISDVERGEL